MFNIYTRNKETQYTNELQIVPGECKNRISKCNVCGDKIYWNSIVINKRRLKKVPLSKPFFAQGTQPEPHNCKLKYKEDESPEYVKPHWTWDWEKHEDFSIWYKVYVTRDKVLKREYDSVDLYTTTPKEWYAQSFHGGK